jgi:transposase
MGRSRGGLTTKIHAVVDAEGRPVVLELSAGQAHDGKAAESMLDLLGDGDILLADRAYDSNAIRSLATERGAWANIPAKSNRKETFAFSQWLYRQRNLVERFFNKVKQCRGIATRYDKNPLNFLAALKLVSVRIWLRSYESTA